MDATAPRAVPASPALLRLLRPRQWPKNVLVLAAPFAAGELDRGEVVAQVALAFVAFSLAASGVYCLNDARDVEADRAHPTKQRRPVASGEISVGAAVGLGVVLLLGGLAVAAAIDWRLLLVLSAYVAVNAAYGWWLRRWRSSTSPRWHPVSCCARSPVVPRRRCRSPSGS